VINCLKFVRKKAILKKRDLHREAGVMITTTDLFTCQPSAQIQENIRILIGNPHRMKFSQYHFQN